MHSRRILGQLGLGKQDVVDLLILIIPELDITTLDYILMNVEHEFDFREQQGLLDTGDNDAE